MGKIDNKWLSERLVAVLGLILTAIGVIVPFVIVALTGLFYIAKQSAAQEVKLEVMEQRMTLMQKEFTRRMNTEYKRQKEATDVIDAKLNRILNKLIDRTLDRNLEAEK